MSTIETSTSLADLVTGRPHLARTFEALGLDFCCGGAQSLDAACAEAGLDLDDVLARLEETPADQTPAGWADLAPPDLVDHLEETHHRYLNESLPYLANLVERVIGAHGANHPELGEVGATFASLRADLEPHLLKEEQILFPMIREMYATSGLPAFHCGSLANPIGVMGAEHDVAGALLSQLRALTGGYVTPDDACPSYEALYVGLAELEADTHLHVHKENNLLFPAVIAEEQRRVQS